MQRLAEQLVKHRQAIFGLFMGIAIVCACLAVNVYVNKDMTKYLPADMKAKQALDIMDEEFGESTAYTLMVKDVPLAEREKLGQDLQAFEMLATVEYRLDDPSFNKDDYALYRVTANVDTYSNEAKAAAELMRDACESRGYECWVDSPALDSTTADLGPVIAVAAIIVMIILFILAASWLEPILLLFVILIAVIINMGTNLFLGSVSETTFACGAILQVVLSMDYLIMLMNRYRREHASGLDPIAAMKNAVADGITAIASSSITTIAGLLCLVVLSFTIGRDMGLVLAKGVLLSLICTFALLPALILWFNHALESTSKPAFHPQMRSLARASYRLRYVAAILLVAIFALGFAEKGLCAPSFLFENKNPDREVIEQQFPLTDQVIILYNVDQAEEAALFAKHAESLEDVDTVNSYATTIGEPLTAAELASEVDMDESLVRLLFYDCKREGATVPMTGAELAEYLRFGMAKDLGDSIDTDTADGLSQLASLVESELSPLQTYTAEQAATAMDSHASVRPEMLQLVYLVHGSSVDFDPSWTMTLEELMGFLVNDVLNDPAFDRLIDAKTSKQLIEANDLLQESKASMVGECYGRLVLDVPMKPTSPEMDVFCTNLRSDLDECFGQNAYLLAGQGPMVQEMAAAFTKEFNTTSLITIAAILLIVLITFRSLFIPILLVSLIQSAFCWDMVVNGLIGNDIYYVAMIVVQSILMGATIDYAILFTTQYREARMTEPVQKALHTAYRNSIRTVMMSGSILVFATLVMGLAVEGITGQICLVISEGSAIALVLVLLVLPGAIATFDRFVAKKGSIAKDPRA